MCGADTLVRDLQCPQLNQDHCLESVTDEHYLCLRTVELRGSFAGRSARATQVPIDLDVGLKRSFVFLMAWLAGTCRLRHAERWRDGSMH